MAYLNDSILDALLLAIQTEGEELHICSQEPTTYTEAVTTYTLGNENTISIASPADRAGGGRESSVLEITSGTVTATGTATHFAIVDVTGTALIATGALSASQAVTNGNTFSLTEFTIGVPDAV